MVQKLGLLDARSESPAAAKPLVSFFRQPENIGAEDEVVVEGGFHDQWH